MAFRREMDDRGESILIEQSVDRVAVRHISANESVVGRRFDFGQVGEITGVRERVVVDHAPARPGAAHEPDQVAPDEPAAPGDEQGALSRLELRIPPDVVVQNVRGAEVADWSIETKTDSGSQQLVVSLKAELTADTDVDIDYFRRDLPATKAALVDSLEPLDVVRETGRVARREMEDRLSYDAHRDLELGEENRRRLPC